jgi:hypothetical protein
VAPLDALVSHSVVCRLGCPGRSRTSPRMGQALVVLRWGIFGADIPRTVVVQSPQKKTALEVGLSMCCPAGGVHCLMESRRRRRGRVWVRVPGLGVVQQPSHDPERVSVARRKKVLWLCALAVCALSPNLRRLLVRHGQHGLFVELRSTARRQGVCRTEKIAKLGRRTDGRWLGRRRCVRFCALQGEVNPPCCGNRLAWAGEQRFHPLCHRPSCLNQTSPEAAPETSVRNN